MAIKQIFASIAASLSLSAFAWPDWNGGAGDSDWWKASNWGNWGESGMPADGITPETLNDPFWGDGSFNYATGPVEVNLGGKAATVTANLWIRYKGESFTLTNGSISAGSDIALRKDSGDVETEGPTLVLDEMDMTVGGSINIGADWRGGGTGTIVVEDGSALWVQNVRMAMTENQQSYYIQNGGITSNYWFGCASRQAQGTGRIELNGGTFNVFEFALDGGGDDPAQINTTLVLNGGLLVPMANDSGWSRDDLVPSWLPIRIGTGGARVETIGKDINFLSTSITAETGDGGFEKSGPGKLTLNAGLVWSGTTKVLEGTLNLNGYDTALGANAQLVLSGGHIENLGANARFADVTIDKGQYSLAETFCADNGTVHLAGGVLLCPKGATQTIDVTGGTLVLTGVGAEDEIALPAGVSFANAERGSNFLVLVQNRDKAILVKVGDDGTVTSSRVDADVNCWLGGGADSKWQTAGNWSLGSEPTSKEKVLFPASVEVVVANDRDGMKIYANEIEVADGAVATLRLDNVWGAETILSVDKIKGAGTFAVSRIKMEGVSEISCARLGVLTAGDNPTWMSGSCMIYGKGDNGSTLTISADIYGTGDLYIGNTCGAVDFTGDNSAWQGGRVRFSGSANQWGNGDVFFRTANSVFPVSRHFEFRGRMFFDFADTANVKWDKFEVRESYGADFLFRPGADVTIRVDEGVLNNGNGVAVYTLPSREGAEPFHYEEGRGIAGTQPGFENFTISMVGNGVFVSALTKGGTVEAASGTVYLSGSNDNGDNRDVRIVVNSGATVAGIVDNADIEMHGGEIAKRVDLGNADAYSFSVEGLAVGSGSATLASPFKGLLMSAAGWYDPSMDETLSRRSDNGIWRIANNGAGGFWLDLEMYNRDNRYECPYLGSINDLGAIAFTNNYTGFRSVANQMISWSAGKSVFAVAKRDNALRTADVTADARVYPVEWYGGWTVGSSNYAFGFDQEGSASYFYRTVDSSEIERTLAEGVSSDNVAYVRSMVEAPSTTEQGKNTVVGTATGYENGQKVSASVSSTRTVPNEWPSCYVALGWSMMDGSRQSTGGVIGEVLAYDRALSEKETALIHSYLGHKWVSSEIPEVSIGANIAVNDLSIDGGTVGFDGAAATIANLTGAGSMTDAASIKVTGTITAKVSQSGSVFTADCAVDLTGTTIVVDESEWEMADRHAAATIFTAQSITGMPTVHREEGESLRFVVTNTGTAIVVERSRPGLMIIIQ